MGEALSEEAARGQAQLEAVVHDCLEAERTRGLAQRSLGELQRYLGEFTAYCRDCGVRSVSGLSPAFLKDYVLLRRDRGGPTLGKALVWALRKLGGYVALVQLLPQNPTRDLHHPKISARAKLPEYLSATQLRCLLETAAHRVRESGAGDALRDFAILSLLVTTGLRPYEIATLKRNDVHLEQHRMEVHVKGGWVKKTPLSARMAEVLAAYLATRLDSCPAAFVNTRGQPVSVSWIQRMVRKAGGDAGFPFELTCRHLRHTFATHAADRHGKTITRALLGHRRAEATEVYAHLSPRHFRAVMNLHPYQVVILEKGQPR
jgi:site-specific recombinase XerD